MKYFSILILFLSQSISAQTNVLMDDFESGIPLYFSMVNNDGFTPDASVSEYSAAWISKVDPDDASNMVASATSFFDPAGLADRWLITPQLNLGAYGNFLSWQGKSHDASFPESYYVLLSNTDDALASFTDTIARIIQEPEYWTTHSVNLSELGYNNQSVHLAVVLRTYDGFKFYLDSMNVWKEDPVALNELTLPTIQFTVAPNPTSDVVTVFSKDAIQSVQIIGLNGELILKGTSDTLFLSNLSAGVYIIEVTTDKGVGRQRIIKN